jgi:hypothetical protein
MLSWRSAAHAVKTTLLAYVTEKMRHRRLIGAIGQRKLARIEAAVGIAFVLAAGAFDAQASLRDALAAQMQYAYFPVTLEQCAAKIRYHDLVEGSFSIDDIKVSARYLNHPALTLGYRLQADGATMVYACDHEPHSRMLAGGNGHCMKSDPEGQDAGTVLGNSRLASQTRTEHHSVRRQYLVRRGPVGTRNARCHRLRNRGPRLGAKN